MSASDEGKRAIAIESHSIDWIPDTERHGKPWQQGPFWFLGNLEFFTVAIGFIGPSMGLALSWSILAGVTGVLFGTIFMAAHATQGPVIGLPQMIQTRAQLGFRGVSITLLAALLGQAGAIIACLVLLSQGLHGTFGWDPTSVAIGAALVAAALSIIGHNLIHRVFQVLLYVSLPFYLLLTGAILIGNIPADVAANRGTFVLAAFLAQFGAGAAWTISYAPFVSDYSRYLPSNTNSRKLMFWVAFGASGSAVWLIALGSWLASSFGATDAFVGVQLAGNHVVNGLGSLLVVLSVFALIGVVALNTYSGHLTLLTAVDSIRTINPSRRTRVLVCAGFAAITLIASLLVTPKAVAVVSTILTLMLYLLVPWTALNLTDYFFVRKGHYKIADLLTPDGMYGSWNYRGLLAYGLGLAVQVPFMVLPGLFIGPLAAKIDDVDIAFILGLVVSGVAYLLLHRRKNYDLGATITPADETRNISSASTPPVR